LLVSRANGPSGAGGNGNSYTATARISADGRFVAFESDADNLSADDNDAVRDIFVRDTLLGTTTLVSRADGPAGVGGDGDSEVATISGDGRFVAFDSIADNLSLGDDNAFSNVFRRDVRGGPPHCTDVVQSVVRDLSSAVGLSCADDDGDALTLAIVSGPAQGVLGAIDQAAATVPYSPSPGAAGADAFTFRASDANGESGAATARLTVAGCSAMATFGSIGCRLEELAAAKAAGMPAGRLATTLERLLGRARTRLAAAEHGGRARAARKALGKAAKALAAFDHLLRSPAAKKLDPVTVAGLRATAAAIRGDVVKLKQASG
jgi:hypothetical protein